MANTNIQEWIKLFQGVGVMKVYISKDESAIRNSDLNERAVSNISLGKSDLEESALEETALEERALG